MANTATEKPTPSPGEALWVLFKGLPLPLFGLGLLASFKEWPGTAQFLMGAAIILWGMRIAIVGPILKIIYGKRRLKAAWAEAKDQR